MILCTYSMRSANCYDPRKVVFSRFWSTDDVLCMITWGVLNFFGVALKLLAIFLLASLYLIPIVSMVEYTII